MSTTLGMAYGDLFIGEKGQPVVINGRNKLVQDINEALNSKFNAVKKFGSGLRPGLSDDVVYDMIDLALNRLIATQKDADNSEKIKSIDKVNIVRYNSTVYAYIEVTSGDSKKISTDYLVKGG